MKERHSGAGPEEMLLAEGLRENSEALLREWIVCIALGLVLYAGTFVDIFHIWIHDEDYGHGIFVPLVVIWLMLRKKEDLYALPHEHDRWAWGMLLSFALCYVAGMMGNIATFVHLSFLFYVVGCIWFFAGRGWVKELVFPICFLVFLFPVPAEIYTRITNPLMLLSSKTSATILQWLNIPVLLNGNQLVMPGYAMRVVMACSGLRSVLSILAVSLLLGNVGLNRVANRIIIVLVAVPVALAGNICRIVSSGLLAHHVSPAAAEGYAHAAAGLVAFGLGIVLLTLVWGALRWREEHLG